jgi:hypothetical protein
LHQRLLIQLIHHVLIHPVSFYKIFLNKFEVLGNTTLFKYGPNNNQSILYIQPRALQSDRSYEFKVILTNIYDTSLTYTGYAVVQVQDIQSVLISAE